MKKIYVVAEHLLDAYDYYVTHRTEIVGDKQGQTGLNGFYFEEVFNDAQVICTTPHHVVVFGRCDRMYVTKNVKKENVDALTKYADVLTQEG